jgi:mannonate dehydratase
VRIADARVIVCSPGRNFVTLKLTTDDGATGLGDATLNGRELAVASYLQDHVCPLLVGRDAGRIEDTWQFLYKGAYWRGGPVGMTAIAAVDTALWDLKGKAAGMPVYDLLGGRARDGVLVYGHANGRDPEEAIDWVHRYVERGYRAVRVQFGVPGVAGTYGVSDDKLYYEPADRAAAPTENLWSSEKYLRAIPDAIAQVRDTFGFDLHLLHDVHHRLRPIEAADLGKRLEDARLFWLEDPVPAELQEGLRLIRSHTTTPIAIGEALPTIWDFRIMIAEQLIDYVRTSVQRAGGISHLRKIASFAELYHVRTGCHGATDLSPVCMAAALHFDISVSNFGIQEYMPHTAETDEVFRRSYTYRDGCLHPGEEPGLGVELDEDAAARFPYERAYLPVNRLLDGTMHSW